MKTKWLINFGVIAPVFYTIVVAILGLLRPGYSHVAQFMSELGETGATNAILMDATFVLFGIMMILFAIGLYYSMRNKFILTCSIFITISGIGMMGSGIYSCDPGCLNESFKGMMHSMSATIPGIGMAIAPLFFAARVKNKLRWYSILTGIVTAVMGIGTFFVTFEGWVGLYQRISMALPLLWMIVISYKIRRE